MQNISLKEECILDQVKRLDGFGDSSCFCITLAAHHISLQT